MDEKCDDNVKMHMRAMRLSTYRLKADSFARSLGYSEEACVPETELPLFVEMFKEHRNSELHKP